MRAKLYYILFLSFTFNNLGILTNSARGETDGLNTPLCELRLAFGDDLALVPGLREAYTVQTKKLRRDYNLLSDEKEYLTSLDDVRTFGIEATGTTEDIKTVLYPFSGSDAGAPARLFPRAVTLMGFSQEPFLSDSFESNSTLEYEPLGQGRFMYIGDLRTSGGVAKRILGGLEISVPGFRLRQVIALRTPLTPKTTESNGIVVFDSGPGTLLRRYIHFQGNIDTSPVKRPPKGWWYQQIEALKPQAVLIKAAMGKFLNNEQPNPKAHRDILAWLRASKGILVEGASVNFDTLESPSEWEFGPYEGYPDETTKVVKTLGFGYGHHARITRFLP